MAENEPNESSEATAGPSSVGLPTSAPAAARPANSILSYFGNGSARAASTSSNSAATAAAPKAKRPKAVALDQARLGTTSSEGSSSGWALGKRVEEAKEEPKPKPRARKKAAKVDEGEEAERKEMAKRAKVEKKVKGKGKDVNGAVVSADADEPMEDGDEDMGAVKMPKAGASKRAASPTKPIPPGPRISDTKRKRSHHKAQPALSLPTDSHPSSQASLPRSTPLDSSPPTIILSSSTESDEDDNSKTGAKATKLPRTSSAPIHPLFSRSSSAISKGASQDDAIHIDDIDSPKRPPARLVIDLADSPQAKKVGGPVKVFAAEKKGVHGFFGMKRGPPAAAGPAEAADLPEGKVAPKAVVKDKVHSFFQPGPKGVPGKLADGWGGDRKIGEEWLVPFPGRGWPSHTDAGGPPTTPTGTLRKRRRSSPPTFEPLRSFFSQLPAPPNPPQHNTQSTSYLIPPKIDHPAIRSIPRRFFESAQEAWCERYRPLAAAQVLGNEGEATYLRDWLQLLSVGHDAASSSTAKVTRRVPRRKAQLLDGWIVDDINDFDDDPEAETDPDRPEFQPFEEAPSALDPRPEAYPAFSGRLANTMLLTGPHGSGKSAAVYAVAEELGWEVFEVYPGIGKRTGSNLMSLVGDVGRNHVIAGKGKGKVTPKKSTSKGGVPPVKANSAAGSFFKSVAVAAASKPAVAAGGVVRRRANQLPPSSQGSADDPLPLDDSDDEEGGGVEVLEDRKHGFRETLILLDEADLLFEEEGSFWPSVIALIAESRRPVVITCNDPESIPISALPLQAILRFQPPPRDLAISLLSAIAKHESLVPIDFDGLYDSCLSSPFDLLAQPTPLVPNGHEPMPAFDLRRAITQMQLDRGRSSGPAADPQPDLELKGICKGLEGRSFVDAWVAPRPWAVVELNEVDRYAGSSDDLLGVNVLPKPQVHPDRPALAACAASSDIAEYLSSLIPSLSNDFPSESLSLKQTTHIRALLPLLDPLIPLSSNLLPHPSLFIEYIPILRSIVLADDLLEIAEEETLARGGERVNRKTGRPVRTVTGWLKGKEEGGYVRYLKEVGKEGESVVRDIQLGMGRV